MASITPMTWSVLNVYENKSLSSRCISFLYTVHVDMPCETNKMVYDLCKLSLMFIMHKLHSLPSYVFLHVCDL